ncbi:MAG: hypothetical protein P9M14_12860 [Candidatus Alcyoniella australis]|nr:hypothetical protein [Candidatus Alcyoniella australis]
MVPLIVIAVFAIAIVVDVVLVRRFAAKRAGKALREPADELINDPEASRDKLFHEGHTWVQLTRATVSVGVDEFTRRFIGRIDSIELPSAGAKIKKGENLWTLRFGDRTLSQPAPLTGRVLEVNKQVQRDPSSLDVHGEGWLVRLMPSALERDLHELYTATRFAKWTELQRDRFIGPALGELGEVYADGGEVVDGAARNLDEEKWRELSKHVFYSG